MRIARFQFNMLPVNTYVLWDTASRECAIVDAGCYYPKEEETLAEFIDDNKLTVKYLLATHLHFDHCFGNSFVAKKYGVILCAAEADEFLLQNMVRQCESFGIPFYVTFFATSTATAINAIPETTIYGTYDVPVCTKFVLCPTFASIKDVPLASFI